MPQFINARDLLVQEAIDGLLRTQAGRLARLDGYPHIKVVVRSDWDRSRVALVSGGGSGHEPAHAGFVGEGMLTAAVCGEVFASPSADAVLALSTGAANTATANASFLVNDIMFSSQSFRRMDGKSGLPPSLDDQETTNQSILQPVAKWISKFLLSPGFLGSNGKRSGCGRAAGWRS